MCLFNFKMQRNWLTVHLWKPAPVEDVPER